MVQSLGSPIGSIAATSQASSFSAYQAATSNSNPSQSLLAVRTELFEHGLFPMQSKLTSTVLVNTFTNLNLLSSIDYKIKLSNWVDQAKRHIPDMIESDAQIYFMTYKALLQEIDTPVQSTGTAFPHNQSSSRDAPLSEFQVDVRCFAIFVALQLFAQTAAEKKSSLLQDSWGMKENQNIQGASPRSKVSKLNRQHNDYAIILHFIKTNLKLFLRLVSTDIHNDEVSLTANEFNSLRVLFKIKNQVTGKTATLASLTPFFPQNGQSIKIHMNTLQDWLLQAVAQTEDDFLGMSQSSRLQPNLTNQPEYIAFLNKCVTVRDITNTPPGKDIRLIGCEDSYIFIGTNVDCLQIQKCVNCTIFVAAVSRVITIDKCENLNVCCASSYLRIGNCVDCQVYSYTQLSPPVIYGDTRSLMLAPHNAGYPELQNTLKEAGINWKTAQGMEQRLSNFSKAVLMRVSKQSISLIPAHEFMKISLPKKWGDCPLFLCPQEFTMMMQLRTEKFAEIQAKIKGANLTHDQEKMLHVAIQGYFREWFVQSQQYKPITDLVKIMDQEF